MKKYLSVVLLIVVLALSMMANISALDEPTPGGKNLFTVEDIMYPGDEGTKFHNAFTQPNVLTPEGTYEHWSGVYFTETTYDGVDCVAVSVDPESSTLAPVMDFNYYQWDSEYYNPSLDAAKYGWLKIKYAYNDAAADVDFFKFYASKDVVPLATENLKSAYKAGDIINGNGKWQEIVIDLSDIIFEDGTEWSENTIRQFRLQMFGANEDPDAICYIAGFGFFETEEEAREWDFGNNGTTEEPEPEEPEELPTITVSDKIGYVGKTVDVTVSINDNPGIMQVGLTVDYDDSVFTLTGVEDGGILGANYFEEDYTKCPYILNWSNSLYNEYGNGVIATLTFEIAEDAPAGTYPITITYDNDNDDILDEDLEPVEFDVVNGSVIVRDYIIGDLSGDFKVTSRDTAYLARYIANWEGYGEEDVVVQAGDVNASDTVTALDTIILARYIARWTGYETLPYGE